MPTAAKIQWPQGQPLLETMWRGISEGLAGNGVVQPGDLEVTATSNDLELNIAAGTVFYQATEYDHGGTVTSLSAGDGTYDRWDTIYFDTGTGEAAVREGTPEADPEAPDLQADEVLLAVVYVPQNATDVPDADVLNWRTTFSNEAEEVHFDDDTGDYGVNNVEAALDTIDLDWVRGRDNLITGLLAGLGTNPGAFGALVDCAVDGSSAAGTEHSYQVALDGTPFIEVYAESDGSGGIQTARVDLPQTARVDGDIVTTGGTTIWNSATGVVPQARLGGPPSSLSSYPLPIGDLDTPYGLPNVTDMDAAGTDLTDSGSGVRVYDATAAHVPRPQVDDEKAVTERTASGTSGSYTTNDEEVVLVDTATNAASYTITLASADAAPGNHILVADSGGAATNYGITVDTEGTETIDGASSHTLDRNYAASLFVSEGTDWYEVGGVGLELGIPVEDDGTTVLNPSYGLDHGRGLGVTDNGDGTTTLDYEHKEVFEGRESGSVSAGNQGVLIVDHLADQETVSVYKAALVNADGSAVASGVNLELVTMDNAGAFTVQSTLIAGDGATVYDDETGSPLATYENTSGAGQTIAVLVDNGLTNAVNIVSSAEGVTGQ